MNKQKRHTLLRLPANTLYPALLIFSGMPQLPPQSSPALEVSIKFPPTEERGAPSGSFGGGTRLQRRSTEEQGSIEEPAEITAPGATVTPDALETSDGAARGGGSCIEPGVTPLTALMPRNNLVTTAAANPLLFWYVPKTTATSAEFVLLDDNQNEEVYRTTFALAGTSSIVYLRPPATAALKVGKTYQWRFVLNCPTHSQKDNLLFNSTHGQIQRVQMSRELQAELAQAQPLEQARLYADARIWSETLMIVIQLRNSYPTEWQELLQSVQLDGPIITAPFVQLRPISN